MYMDVEVKQEPQWTSCGTFFAENAETFVNDVTACSSTRVQYKCVTCSILFNTDASYFMHALDAHCKVLVSEGHDPGDAVCNISAISGQVLNDNTSYSHTCQDYGEVNNLTNNLSKQSVFEAGDSGQFTSGTSVPIGIAASEPYSTFIPELSLRVKTDNSSNCEIENPKDSDVNILCSGNTSFEFTDVKPAIHTATNVTNQASPLLSELLTRECSVALGLDKRHVSLEEIVGQSADAHKQTISREASHQALRDKDVGTKTFAPKTTHATYHLRKKSRRIIHIPAIVLLYPVRHIKKVREMGSEEVLLHIEVTRKSLMSNFHRQLRDQLNLDGPVRLFRTTQQNYLEELHKITLELLHTLAKKKLFVYPLSGDTSTTPEQDGFMSSSMPQDSVEAGPSESNLCHQMESGKQCSDEQLSEDVMEDMTPVSEMCSMVQDQVDKVLMSLK